jgi:hypothetical protein
MNVVYEEFINQFVLPSAGRFFKELKPHISETLLDYDNPIKATRHQNGYWFTCGKITINWEDRKGFDHIPHIDDDAEGIFVEVYHYLQVWLNHPLARLS